MPVMSLVDVGRKDQQGPTQKCYIIRASNARDLAYCQTEKQSTYSNIFVLWREVARNLCLKKNTELLGGAATCPEVFLYYFF